MPVDIHALPRWLQELLHLDPDRIPEDADAWLSFKRWPESGWGLLAVLAILVGILFICWVYRREGALSTSRKIVFAGFRIAVLLAIALSLFYPVLELSVERDQEAVTLVLLDDSLSFGFHDAFRSNPELGDDVAEVCGVERDELDGLSRAEIARRLINRDSADFLQRLAENNRLEIYAFSDRLTPIAGQKEPGTDESGDENGRGRSDGETGGSEEGRRPIAVSQIAPADLEPRGTSTDIGGSLRAVVGERGSTPVAAIVLVTDGRRTEGEDPAGVALFLAERRIPVHAIGLGDPSPTRNLRIMGIFVPERVFAGDPIAVDVRVDHHGFQDEAVKVELTRELIVPEGGAEAGEGTRVGSEELRFTEGTDATARFELRLARPGHYRLRARIAARPEETFDHDNERTAVVEVVDQATKVLFVAGAPSNEYRILKNLLRRDRRVELASWLMSADPDYPQEGDVVLKKLPSVARELFEYDVVILMDVDPRGLPAGWGELLERFVGKHRGGLAYVAGEKYTTPFFRSTALGPIHDLLPIEPNQVRAEDEFARGRFHQKEWPLVPTVEAAAHPATRISSRPDRNRERWAELTGVYWSFPARKAKPAATVLLRHSDPSLAQRGVGRPLLATQFYEGGRSLYLGFDETWRWRSLNEELYDQFWMQMMRSLTEGRLLGDRRKLVLTDRNDYGLGDVVRISALVQDREYQPSTEESVEVEVRTPEGTTRAVTLERDPSQAGWFRGVYMPATVGVHEVKIEGGTAKSVQVEIPDVEFEDPRLDPVTLRDLAEVTGGSVTLPGDLASYVEIPDRIPDRRRRVVLTDEPRPLWDNALTLGLVVMLLTLEWIGRKWSRLP